MAKSAIHALSLGQRNRVFLDGVQDFFVTSEKVIFAKEDGPVAPIYGGFSGGPTSLMDREISF
jgi:hypothetical protein